MPPDSRSPEKLGQPLPFSPLNLSNLRLSRFGPSFDSLLPNPAPLIKQVDSPETFNWKMGLLLLPIDGLPLCVLDEHDGYWLVRPLQSWQEYEKCRTMLSLSAFLKDPGAAFRQKDHRFFALVEERKDKSEGGEEINEQRVIAAVALYPSHPLGPFVTH